ncbi:MAG: CopG family transcriptional regulator [Euryarchaeota archaeon]|nr:CopG family transcriptional regulator [Euryarchaeota archaeon]
MEPQEPEEKVNERVTIRLEQDDIVRIDAEVEKAGLSRSEFIRNAVNDYIDRGGDKKPARIIVELTPLERSYIDKLVDKGYFSSREQAVRKCLDQYFNKHRISEINEEIHAMATVAGHEFAVDIGEKKAREETQR